VDRESSKSGGHAIAHSHRDRPENVSPAAEAETCETAQDLAEEIVRREKAGESLKSIAKSVGISKDRAGRLANRVRNRPLPTHCQAYVKYRQCKYCVDCFKPRRMLQHRAVYNGPLGLQARAELKQFDKAEKGGRKKAA
jgi:hypothetical protein